MEDGTSDTLRLQFPASTAYSRLGRVTVAGLALRLGVDVGTVEQLRLAVDRAVALLNGPGAIVLDAVWEPHAMAITLTNEDVSLEDVAFDDAQRELTELVHTVERHEHGLTMRLRSSEA